jgi:hypothetical protein
MKINTKILVGFLMIIVLCLAQLAVAYKLQSRILNNVRQIKDVEAPLEIMSEQVIGYGALLTGQVHAALIHAQKGNHNDTKEHKLRYDEGGTKLDELLKNKAIVLLNQSQRAPAVKNQVVQIIKDLDVFNLKLVDLETRAFTAMDKGDVETAYALVVGGDYDKYKAELYQKYSAWAQIEHDMTLNMRNVILKNSEWLVMFNFYILIAEIVVIVIILLVVRSFISSLPGRQKNKK